MRNLIHRSAKLGYFSPKISAHFSSFKIRVGETSPKVSFKNYVTPNFWTLTYSNLLIHTITCVYQRGYIITAQKMNTKDFFSKSGQIRSFLQIWLNLLKKSLVENFIFCAVYDNV